MALPTPIPTRPFTDWDWASTNWDDPLTNWDQTDPPTPPPPPSENEVEDPTSGAIWAATLNGITFGVHPFIWEEDGPDIFGWDDVRDADSVRPGGDGLISLNPDWMSARIIDLPVFINLTDERAALEAQRAVATAWKRSASLQRLSIVTPMDRYTVFGRPRKLFTGVRDVHTGLIRLVARFVATDPIFYSDEHTRVGTLTSTAGGMSMPHSFPHDFGSANAGGVSVDNEGNTDTNRVVIILSAGAASLVNPRLELLTTGEELVFDLTLAPSQTLWIDFAARTVRLNNTTSRSASLVRPDSTWWSIPPGEHQVRFAGTGNASISVTHRSAWIL